MARPEGLLELNFLLPAAKRDAAAETIIRDRLHSHFERQARVLGNERWQAIKHGSVVALVGIALMLAAALLHRADAGSLSVIFLTTMLEPAGWYVVWYGMDEVFYGAKRIAAEHQFYSQMAEARITFGDLS